MKKLSNEWIWSIIVIVSLVVWGAWFLTNYQLVLKQREIGFQGEARYNDLLAAQRFIEKMGTAAETVTAFSQLKQPLSVKDTVILATHWSYIDRYQVDFLLEWVNNGGSLIVTHRLPSNNSSQKNKYNSHEHFLEITQTKVIEKKKSNDDPYKKTTLVTLNNLPLTLMIDTDLTLETAQKPSIELTTEQGTYLLSHQYGKGYITVVTDLFCIENEEINHYDHAAFLWKLVHLSHTATKVWLWQPIGEGFSLFALLKTYGWMVFVSATVFLILWLWAISRRFGSVLPEPSLARRRLLEHIEASAYYLWQHKQSDILLERTRQAVLQRLESVHPDWLHLKPPQLYDNISQISAVTVKDVQQALHAPLAKTPATFTTAIQTLSKIRKAL
ncbi:DUF4350 domain-containing protein [Beggiatoa leptomitoformis]|uniref:DUF4350 domain-containing protein n=1 Tax=Beggiatoa leptomitoformis TaxID=288004 RepID=A0A2N9YDT5_9GAMM|nr:DUF4350 domain-containing protein [Beggiatoa leptomitoformis]ALG68970.1 hypothetical protein AL038_16320 [Beggiatoa leptomitoformis]AUI68640.1 hypothetical protein BLE401_07925 [Beggiatoa leptomitoformis]